ncbi:YbaN family protein [Bacillus suaedaesalsae]
MDVIRNVKKVIYILLGFIFMGLGMIGIVLPLLPTTPLLLLASFFFVKGSSKFEKWFKGTNVYKNHLEEFVKNRAMTRKQKLTILLFADFMIAIPFFLTDSNLVKVFLLLIVVYKYYYFITKIKTIKKLG